jgi:endonuclease/exonuclease/phosphatase (EEP) superfamily protein YafD
MPWSVSTLLIFIAALFLFGGLLSFIETGVYFLELPTHFQLQYFWFGLIFIFLVWHFLPSTPSVVYVIMAIALMLNIVNLWPWLNIGDRPHTEKNDHSAITLLQANVFKFNFTHDALINLIYKEKPDIIVLAEVTPRWQRALYALYTDWPHILITPEDGSHGMAVFSKYPFEDARVVFMSDRQIPSYILDIQAGDQRFKIVSVHPLPPVTQNFYQNRNQHFDWIQNNLDRLNDAPLIITGDFNISMYAPRYKSFARHTGLNNARHTQGIYNGWFVYDQRYLGIPIDHVLHNDRIQIEDFRTGADIKSDHLPTITRFTISD